MLRMNCYSVGSRLYLGFATLVVLTIGLALFCVLQLSNVGDQVQKLVGLSQTVARILEAGRLIETLRRTALTYEVSGDADAASEFFRAKPQALGLIRDAAADTLSAERLQTYRHVQEALDTLDPKFQRLVEIGKNTKSARDKLFVGGDELTDAATHLVEVARPLDRLDIVAGARNVESATLLVRVANWRFLATHDPNGPALFKANVANAEKEIDEFRQQVSVDAVRAAIGPVSAALSSYSQSFNDISVSLQLEDQQYSTSVAPAITDMQSQLESARVSLLHDLDKVQASTDRQIATTSLSELLVSALILVLGAGLAFLLARSISRPLRIMTDAMMKVAAGDLSADIVAREGKDEIADMAKAVQVFKDNGIEMRRLRAFVVASIGAGLERLSNGDLTFRLTDSFAGEFAKLQADFNSAMERLESTMTVIANGAVGVHSNTQDIAGTSKQQQATATEIAATTSEIGATSKEISATSKELGKTMSEVSTVAEQTAALATKGQAGLSRMEKTMDHVIEAAGSINAKLAVLNEKAANINQVVTTITKVADQTNLLSLNAAIEAEKAGESGRGFAVVAAEIRRLADQTGVATYDIEQMIKEIQSAISAGVMGMDKFSEEVRRGMREVHDAGNQLSQIIHQVQALVPRFETVNEGMQAQATGAEQISEALLQLSDAAQQTVESLRRSTQAIDELNQLSGGLRGRVSRFKLRA